MIMIMIIEVFLFWASTKCSEHDSVLRTIEFFLNHLFEDMSVVEHKYGSQSSDVYLTD